MDMILQAYGSQGQQRTTALSLKLAEIDLVKQEVGETPVLLLDDVLSELDDYRQSHLLNTMQGASPDIRNYDEYCWTRS